MLTCFSFNSSWWSLLNSCFCSVATCSRNSVMATTWSEELGSTRVSRLIMGRNTFGTGPMSSRSPRPTLVTSGRWGRLLWWWLLCCCSLDLEELECRSECFVLAKARLYDKVHSQQSIFPSTFFLSSSFRSNAHFCLHCSQVTGGPYFFSELVHLWHLLPMKAAIMLQYSQAEGFPYCLTLNSHFLQIVHVLPLLSCWNSDLQ